MVGYRNWSNHVLGNIMLSFFDTLRDIAIPLEFLSIGVVFSLALYGFLIMRKLSFFLLALCMIFQLSSYGMLFAFSELEMRDYIFLLYKGVQVSFAYASIILLPVAVFLLIRDARRIAR